MAYAEEASVIYQVATPVLRPESASNQQDSELAELVGETQLFHCYTIRGVNPMDVWEINCNESLLSFILLRFNAKYLGRLYEQH